MIDLYYFPTPNGKKLTIFLEEAGLAYNVIKLDIRAGAQFDPKFLAISPNNKMPAIVDPQGPDGKPIAIFESGAILIYLAEKTGLFMPREMRARYNVIQWLMFQMASVGPMMGQAGHFRNYAPEKIPYALERYTNEEKRILGVMDHQLADHEFLAGEYSIADMATYPWVFGRWTENELGDFPHVTRWCEAMDDRPGVKRGMAVRNEWRKPMDPQAKEILFGAKQYERR